MAAAAALGKGIDAVTLGKLRDAGTDFVAAARGDLAALKQIFEDGGMDPHKKVAELNGQSAVSLSSPPILLMFTA